MSSGERPKMINTNNIKEREPKKIISALERIQDKSKIRCYVEPPFVSTTSVVADYVSNRVNYFLYPAKIEINSKTFFIYTQKRLTTSEAEFYLTGLDKCDEGHLKEKPPDLAANINKICNILEIPTKVADEELSLKERFEIALTNKHNFLKERAFLEESEFDAFLNGEHISDSVDLILHQGYEKDEQVVLLYKSQLLEFEDTIQPKRLMPYQSHGLAFTNTKTGKTSTADTIGEKIDRLTSARLLGYSDAKGVYPGDIDHQTKPFFAEEIGDAPEDSAIDLIRSSSYCFTGSPKDIR